jgi:hypothetical protein
MNKAALHLAHADMRDNVAAKDQHLPPRQRTALGEFPSNQEILSAGTGGATPPSREEAALMQSHHARRRASIEKSAGSHNTGTRTLEGAAIGAFFGAVIGAVATVVFAAGASWAVPGADWVISGSKLIALAGAVAGALTGAVVGAIVGKDAPVFDQS